MRVIFLGLAIPNLDDYLNMFTELMVEFRDKGHDLVVVGPTLDDNRTGLHIENDIQVLRVPTLKLFGVGKFQKGLANIMLPYQYKKALKKCGIDLKFDLIIMPTPPITLANAAAWLKRKNPSSKLYLVLRDIFPQNAVDLKMMADGGMIFNYFRKQEVKMYRVSDVIGCMSQGNIDFVIKQNPSIDTKKLRLLPNWSKLLPLSTDDEVAQLKKQYKLEDKFVVLFGGNIGIPQKMVNMVALAKSCLDIEDIFFLIIGVGNEKENLKNLIASENLTNTKLIGPLSRADFFDVLQIAEVGLISLSEDFTIPNIPSKSLVYYNTKKPILAALDKNTDFGKILDDADCGLWAGSTNTPLLKEKLMGLYNDEDRRHQMGLNGYNYFKSSLLTHMAYDSILEHISEN